MVDRRRGWAADCDPRLVKFGTLISTTAAASPPRCRFTKEPIVCPPTTGQQVANVTISVAVVVAQMANTVCSQRLWPAGKRAQMKAPLGQNKGGWKGATAARKRALCAVTRGRGEGRGRKDTNWARLSALQPPACVPSQIQTLFCMGLAAVEGRLVACGICHFCQLCHFGRIVPVVQPPSPVLGRRRRPRTCKLNSLRVPPHRHRSADHSRRLTLSVWPRACVSRGLLFWKAAHFPFSKLVPDLYANPHNRSLLLCVSATLPITFLTYTTSAALLSPRISLLFVSVRPRCPFSICGHDSRQSVAVRLRVAVRGLGLGPRGARLHGRFHACLVESSAAHSRPAGCRIQQVVAAA